MAPDRETFYQLYEVERLSLEECGRRFGFSYRTAWKWARRYGFDTHSRLGAWRRGKSKGRVTIRDGYVLVYAPDHPNAKQGRYMYEHRLVMEKHLGRYLTNEEVVHHINGDTSDNRIENLQLFASNGEHLRETLGKRWSRKWDRCQACGSTEHRHEARGLCYRCNRGYGTSDRRVCADTPRWSRNWDCCRRCGRSDRPHKGDGRCRACYNRDWRRSH